MRSHVCVRSLFHESPFGSGSPAFAGDGDLDRILSRLGILGPLFDMSLDLLSSLVCVNPSLWVGSLPIPADPPPTCPTTLDPRMVPAAR